jgi:hypothetical protein
LGSVAGRVVPARAVCSIARKILTVLFALFGIGSARVVLASASFVCFSSLGGVTGQQLDVFLVSPSRIYYLNLSGLAGLRRGTI